MASAAQIRANRANSAHSTGPRTPEGVAACNGNALRHGLTSKQIILKGESAEDFEALVSDLAASYHPANAAESILVSQIAEHYWRLLRVRGMETAHWEKRIAANDRFMRERNPPREHPSAARQLVTILELDDSGSLEKLARYEAAIERSYYRAIKQLEHLQLVRRKEEKQIGSVSQPAKPAPPPRAGAEACHAAMPPEPAQNPAGYTAKSAACGILEMREQIVTHLACL